MPAVLAARILVLDSYDSFVFNLVQYLGELGAEPVVRRNDAVTVDEAMALEPAGVLLSPGPGTTRGRRRHRPGDARLRRAGTPVLGVCLGQQAIGYAYGASIVGAAELMHGKTSEIDHDGRGIFAGLPSPLTATRYHSLVIDPATLPDCLEVSAAAADGTIMGVRHRDRPVDGVQFHPESVLTACGHDLLRNWLATCGQAFGRPDLTSRSRQVRFGRLDLAQVAQRVPVVGAPSDQPIHDLEDHHAAHLDGPVVA